MKVAIGIPTYNRRHLVELQASSLRASTLPPDSRVIVIDDCSTEYDTAYLKSIYPSSSEIRGRPVNSGGASFAQRELMEQLLQTEADAVMLLDSDLIVGQNFLTLGAQLLQTTQGVLSLFNTPNHPGIDSRGPLLIKKSIGCAGSMWKRETALKMMSEVGPGVEFDWRFSNYLNQANIEICVVRNSLVQHLGYSHGQNHNFESGDFGVGFGEADANNAYRAIELLMGDNQARARDVKSHVVALQQQNEALFNQNQVLQTRSEMLQSQIAIMQSQSKMHGHQAAIAERRLRRIERLLGIDLLRNMARFLRGRQNAP